MISKLKSIVGENNISKQKIDRLAYSSDASQIEGKAKVIAWPQKTEQVQKIVRQAEKTKSNIVPRGAGTGLAGAAVPSDSIVLDFSRMNSILELNAKEKYVIVEPGVVLNDLNNYLAKFNLFFPVIPASHKVCTIGGMISTNASGERAVKFGETAQWVNGIELIDGKGNLHNLKKRSEIKDFCGTEGTLGIITKAKLALTEQVKDRSMSLLKFDRISDLVSSVKKHQTESDVIAIEFFDKLSAKLAGLDEKYHLFIELESKRGAIKSEKKIREIWNMREGIGPVLSSADFVIMEDPKIPFEKLDEFLKWLEENKVPCFGHIGTGIIHPRFKDSQGKLIDKMFALVEKIDGKVSGEHGIGLAKKKFANSEFIEKIKSLKAKYDSGNLLNKGKVI